MLDIYKWAENNPKTSIAAAIKRIQNIFDEADEIFIGFSGGKDSSLTLQLCLMELKRRRENKDKKWLDKKLWVNFMNSEWLYSDVISFVNKFIKENKNYLNCFYKCLQLGWNSGVTFGDNRLISWDPDKKNIWITDMPLSKDIGFDIITNDNIKYVNLVPLNSLSKEMQDLRLKDSELVIKNNIKYIPNFGLGNTDLNKKFNCWTFRGEDEDFEQETFGFWLLNQFPNGTKIYNLISLRADESFDRYTILKQCNFNNGIYGFQQDKKDKTNNSIIYLSSPIFDMKTVDVWRCMSACDFKYSKIYDKMYEAGVPIQKQRIASLLHTCGVRNINQLQALEPLLYRKISARFQNIDFISQFSKKGYYHIGKPADTTWNGRNHKKAGVSNDVNNELANKYEYYLKKYNIEYIRENNEFLFKGNKTLFADTDKFSDEDKEEIRKLNNIHITWKDYCLYMLNTSLEPAKSNWRNKMITDILKLRFQAVVCPLSTKDALQILTELPDDFTNELNDDIWHENDWRFFGSHRRSKKDLIAIVRYPQESLEQETLNCIKYICEKKDENLINSSPTLYKFCEKWNNGEIYTPEEYRRSLITKNKLNKVNVSGDYWENNLKGATIWFKENIHSTSSWKRFAVAIYQGDYTLKYLGFVPSYKERMARRIINK